MEKIVKEIKDLLQKVRPYLNRDGGDVEFVRFEDGIVYVRMLGACAGCMGLDSTLKDGIEMMLIDNVDGVLEVRNVDGDDADDDF